MKIIGNGISDMECKHIRHGTCTVLIVSLTSCNYKCKVVIRAAWCGMQRHGIIFWMSAASAIMSMILAALMRRMWAAMPFVTFMFRMNIRTCKSTDESGYKASFTCLAGMNAEAYDTETVPYRKQQCAESEQPTFHTNMQSYKNHSNCKIAFCLKSNHKNLTESIKKTGILIRCRSYHDA